MFEKIFFKIGLRYFKFRFRKKKDDIQNFTRFINDGDKVLIIFPDEARQFEDAKNTFINLDKKWESVELHFLIQNHVLPNTELTDDLQKYEYTAMDINRFFLPKKILLKKILNDNYNISIDLNLNMNLASGYLSKATGAKFRIGIKKELSDLFYNFQFDPIEYTNISNIYKNLFKNLSMFSKQE